MKSEEPFSLEEQLVLTNEELKSNWTKLASLIRAYEQITWDEAKAKASLLLKEKSADNYIDAVRAFPDGKPSEDPNAMESAKKLPDSPSFNSVYEGNYKRLLKVAPGLDEILENPEKEENRPQHGKSESSVYMDLHLDILDKERAGYHIALSQYYKENGDMIADPDMRLLVDVKNKTVQALEFQNALIYRKVYDDSYKRKMVDLREKNGQNKFLRDWLKTLLDQDHEIVWDEPEKAPEPESEIIDIYQKTEKEDSEPTSEPTETSKEENMKKEEETGKESSLGGKKTDTEKRLKKERLDNLLKSNYQKLVRMIPTIVSSADPGVPGLIKTERSEVLPRYLLSRVSDLNKMTTQFAIYETGGNSGKDKTNIATLMVAVMRVRKMAWVSVTHSSFYGMENYLFDEKNTTAEDRYKINKRLEKWLDYLLSNDYHSHWGATQITVDPKPEQPEKAEPKPEPQKQPTDEVPDFEIGHVQLTEAHKRLGLKQKDINWINKHRQGMVLTPRKTEPIHNTKSMLIDMTIQAKRPGCRISATGKIYYEGRTNRSDLTDAGL